MTHGEEGDVLLLGALPAPAWQQGRNGRVALLRVGSPGAAAYRFHFEQLRIPPGASLFLYGIDSSGAVTTAFGPYEEAGPLDTGEFRSRILSGSQAVIELQASEPMNWPFHLERITRMDAATLHSLRQADVPGLHETEVERKPPRGERRSCLFRGQRRECEIINGQAVVEGDIVVGPADEIEPGGSKSDVREAMGIAGAQYRWPSGVIRYTIDASLVVNGATDARITAAIQYWNQTLPGILALRNGQADYVKFRQAAGSSVCQSSVGRRGGVQTIDIGSGCSTGNVIHEIGHAAGLFHEHTREDRDNYVVIVWANIWPDNTITAPSCTTMRSRSPEIVGPTAGMQTIFPICLPDGVVMGQRNALSSGDIAGVKN